MGLLLLLTYSSTTSGVSNPYTEITKPASPIYSEFLKPVVPTYTATGNTIYKIDFLFQDGDNYLFQDGVENVFISNSDNIYVSVQKQSSPIYTEITKPT